MIIFSKPPENHNQKHAADLFGIEGVDADGLNFDRGEAGFTGSAGGCVSLNLILAQGNPGPVVHCLTSFFVNTPLL